jgi:hypothetical protein
VQAFSVPYGARTDFYAHIRQLAPAAGSAATFRSQGGGAHTWIDDVAVCIGTYSLAAAGRGWRHYGVINFPLRFHLADNSHESALLVTGMKAPVVVLDDRDR